MQVNHTCRRDIEYDSNSRFFTNKDAPPYKLFSSDFRRHKDLLQQNVGNRRKFRTQDDSRHSGRTQRNTTKHRLHEDLHRPCPAIPACGRPLQDHSLLELPSALVRYCLKDYTGRKPDLVEICDKYTLNWMGGLLRKGFIPGIRRPVLIGRTTTCPYLFTPEGRHASSVSIIWDTTTYRCSTIILPYPTIQRKNLKLP